MVFDPILVVLVLLVAVLAAGLLWLVAMRSRELASSRDQERQSREVSDAISAISSQQSELSGRLLQMAEAQAATQAAQTKAFQERLDALSSRVGDNLRESSTKTAESLGKLQTRLTVIDQAQKNIAELSGQVVGLQEILANKQARGAFGQVRMEDLVRDALPPSAYEFQATLNNGKRPDCVIHLPNPPGSIIIDAKFPLEAYQALVRSEDDDQKKIAGRAFRTATLKHVDDICSKYILPGETAESALMFLPSEAVYAELHASFPEVVQQSFRSKVWIVSPTTLMATLNTVRAVLKDAQMREQAHVIQREVMTMLDDVGRLQKRVADLRKHFGQAEKDINLIETSSEKIVTRGERIEQIQIEGPDSGEPQDLLDGAVPPPMENGNGHASLPK